MIIFLLCSFPVLLPLYSFLGLRTFYRNARPDSCPFTPGLFPMDYPCTEPLRLGLLPAGLFAWSAINFLCADLFAGNFFSPPPSLSPSYLPTFIMQINLRRSVLHWGQLLELVYLYVRWLIGFFSLVVLLEQHNWCRLPRIVVVVPIRNWNEVVK